MNLFPMTRALTILSMLGLPVAALAQANLVVNGDFTKFTTEENLWDGVDAQDFLAGFRRGTYAVTEGGRVGDQPMPISVNFLDMNADGLPDLATADPAGVVRVYFNSGTKTEPKFTLAETVPIFPPQVAKDNRRDRGQWTVPYGVPKISFFDWKKRGVADLVYGNYIGDLVMLPGTGKPNSPSFDQPSTYERAKISMATEHPWASLLAPCAVDWNKDNKTDLLVGDGTYSANAVYVLLNQSSSADPKFTNDQRFYLCYGDGREQLVPTVIDYNGDGHLDVLIGDRLGTVSVHLHPGNWKPGQELTLSSMIRFGDKESLGTAVAPYAADYNGDGLFELLLGKADGHIAVSINSGTKTEPKFGPATDIKGTNLWKDNVRTPTTWTLDPGNNRANLYGYAAVTEEKSPNGGLVLKCGYFPSPNKVIAMKELTVDAHTAPDFFHYWRDEWIPVDARNAGLTKQTNTFIIRQLLRNLKVGGSYQVSFKVKGFGVRDGSCNLAYIGALENNATKFQKTLRGGAKPVKDETHEEIIEKADFTSTKDWTTVEKSFQVRFKDRGLKDLNETTHAILEFRFDLVPYQGEYQFADVQLIEKPAAAR